MSVVTSNHCIHKCRHAGILVLSSPECIVHINTHMQSYYSVVTCKYCSHKCRHADIICLSSPVSIAHINTDMQAYYFCRNQQVLCTGIHTCRHIISIVTGKYFTHKYTHADILLLSSPASNVHINTDMRTYYFCRHLKYCTHKCRHAGILFLSSPASIVRINTGM